MNLSDSEQVLWQRAGSAQDNVNYILDYCQKDGYTLYDYSEAARVSCVSGEGRPEW